MGNFFNKLWNWNEKAREKMNPFGDSGSSKEYLKKFDTLNHEQKRMLHDLYRHPEKMGMDLEKNPLYQQGSDYYSRLMSQDPEMMKQFTDPYMREFNEQTVPQIAEQFGGMGAKDSSAFAQTLGSAGAGLQERLASIRGQLGLQGAQGMLGYAQAPGQMNLQRATLGLGTPAFGYQHMGGQPGMMQGMSSGAGQAAMSALLMKLLPMLIGA